MSFALLKFITLDTCQPYLACSNESTEGFCPHVDTTCSAINTCKTCDTFGGMVRYRWNIQRSRAFSLVIIISHHKFIYAHYFLYIVYQNVPYREENVLKLILCQ